MLQSYTYYFVILTFYEYLALYFAEWCTGACAPFYLRLPQDAALVLKHVRVVKTYAQFVILLLAIIGECE